jgi:hypothetical protein
VSYKLKCLSYGLVLYLTGVALAATVNTLDYYIADYPIAVACGISSIALYGLAHGNKGVSITINQLDERTEHSKEKEFHQFVDYLKRENRWLGLRDRYWYYALTFGLITSIFVAFLSGLFDGPLFILNAGQNFPWLRPVALLVFSSGLGYALSNGFCLAHGYAFCINKYSDEFVKPEKTRLFPSEEAGGFKPLGILALRINIASAIGVVYALTIMYKGWVEKGYTLLNRPIYMFLLIIYACALAYIFFYPLMPVHTALANAKKRASDHINNMIKQKSKKGFPQKPEDCQALGSLLTARQNINRVPTWPLSSRLSIGSAASILFPLVGGAILQIWIEFWLKGGVF